MARHGSTSLLLCILIVSACSSSSSVEPGDESPTETDGDALTYYEHAKPILDGKCAQCHFDGGIGPMPLTSYEEVQPYLGLIRGVVASGAMPPWMPDAPMHFYEGDRRLSDAQKDRLLTWIEEGGAEGDPDREPARLEQEARRLEKVDLELRIPERYTPDIEPDDYRCFVMEWPHDETKYITALDIVPDNLSMVHHAIVYHAQPENADTFRQLDADQEGEGYTCFGGSGGTASWLTSYEPGGHAQPVPGGLGFEVRPGSVMVLQVHYNTQNGLGEDRSWVEFTVEDHVDRVGRVALFMETAWLRGNMDIPVGEADVVHSWRGRPLTTAEGPLELFWVDLHMHALGRSGRIGIIREGDPDTAELLLDIPNWDFAWQETFVFSKPQILQPGDELYLECHFDNTEQNQLVIGGERLAARDVNWGDGTTDEMCLGNVLIAPVE